MAEEITVGCLVEVVGYNNPYLHFKKLGDQTEVWRIEFGDIVVRHGCSIQVVGKKDLKLIKTKEQMLKSKKDAIIATATRLLQANNTVSTLEIKAELRVKFPDYYWDQTIVSSVMDNEYRSLGMTYSDNGTYRTYSLVGSPVNAPVKKGRGRPRKPAPFVQAAISTPKRGRGRPRKTPVVATVPTVKATVVPAGASKISRKKALELMENNGGRFFTVVFVKKDGSKRTMSCQYLKDQTDSKLGYVKVKEASAMKRGDANCIKQVNIQTLMELRITGKHFII